eukprot:gnl/TRDRNA2_/TRDRNA2_177817_c0_seq40.p1 gnl/TRDRNA2_/TRDRNA2_177817_c0~~gnl/TRDRNA2_/TRDRNA2_177817_c0_seq40.p1  ORF type:complete len:351 (+),score=18.75 gnl/TRDRNA2_/TRDRNA2_177817_c0_seq40:56-1108(+)
MDFSVAALLCFLLQSYRHAGAIRLKYAIRGSLPENPEGSQDPAEAAERDDVRFSPNYANSWAIRLKQAIRALRLKKNVPIRETPLGYQNSAKAAEHTDVRFIQHYAKSSTAAKCNSMLVTRAKENCGGHGCGIVFVGDSIMEHLTDHDCYTGSNLTTGINLTATRMVHRNMLNSSDFNLSMVIPDYWHPFLLSYPGQGTQHTIRDLERTLPWLKTPKVFMVLIGTNNLWRFGRVIPTTDTARGVEAAVNYIRGAHPKAKVLLHGILPRGIKIEQKRIQPAIDETNKLLQSFSQSGELGVEYIDCGHVFRNQTDMLKLMPDLTHPSKLGYIKWFTCLKPLLAHAMHESTYK